VPSSLTDSPEKKPPVWSVGTLTYSLSGLVVLFAWLLMGDFAWNARERTVIPLTQIMLKAGGASDTLVGLLVGALPAALGMFLSPIVAYRSDRCRSRFGRRIPFLLISTPLATISMVGLAFASHVGQWLHQALGGNSPGFTPCFLTFFCLCWVVFEVAAITGNNLFLALINDVVPRAVIGRFFGLFRIVSLGVAIAFNFFLMGKAESHLLVMFLGLAAVYGLGFGLMCLKVKEGTYPPQEEKRLGLIAAGKQYFKECFYHPYYRWLFGASALAAAAFTPVNTFSIFYAKSVGMGLDYYGKALAAGFVGSLISYPIGLLADRVHPLRIAIASLFLYVPLCFWGVLFAKTPGTFAFGFAAHVIITGLFFTGTASLGQRLYPKENFAQFAAAAQIVLGLVSIVIPPVMGALLDGLGNHYPFTFLAGGIISFAAIVGFCVLLSHFKRLGGDEYYSPPVLEARNE
jgi:MFS family permease